MTYEEVRCEIAERYGISPVAVDDWSLDQVESVWRGGRRDKGIRVTSLAEAKAVKRDWRKYLGI